MTLTCTCEINLLIDAKSARRHLECIEPMNTWMKRTTCTAALLFILSAGLSAQSNEGSATQPVEEQVLTGQIVAAWCYLREGTFGTGRLNNTKQINCIRMGSPIALKVNETFYLISCGDEKIKSKLTIWAGYQVTVRGILTEKDNQPTIVVSHAQRTKVKP